MDSMLVELKDIMRGNKHEDSYDQMEAIVLERWGKMKFQCVVWVLLSHQDFMITTT